MAVVAQGNNWYIESFHVARAAIADQAERATTHTLERAGVLIGGSATMDHDIVASAVTGLSLVLRETDSTELVIGANITTIQSVFMNDSGGSKTVGETVLILLRNP